MISEYYIDNAGNISKQITEEFNYKWIHIFDTHLEEIAKISKEYSLPIDYMSSALDPDEVSRQEGLDMAFGSAPILISFLYPLDSYEITGKHSFTTNTISIILSDNILFTCCESTPDFIKDMLIGNFSLVQSITSMEHIVIEIMWRITKLYIHSLKVVDQKTDTIHLQMLKSTRSEILLELSMLQRSVIYFDTSINENKPIIQKISESDLFKHEQNFDSWIHDVLVENHQAEKMVYQTGEMLDKLSDLFSGIVSNNLNIVMKFLTSLTIIATIPTITAGLWGMNMALPFEKHPQAFWIVILITLIFCLLCAHLLKRKDMF